MVEMLEAQKALANATADSLIIFDEIGRGTSTYDGLALAQSMIEYVAHTSHAKTLISTYYHELTTLDQTLKCLKNVHVAANEYNGELIFLHKVKDGAVDDSYGIQVAQLAHLPEAVIERAQVILNAFEQHDTVTGPTIAYDNAAATTTDENNVTDDSHNSDRDDQFEQATFDLFDVPQTESEVEIAIKQLNLSNMTPIDALVKLNELQNQLK